MAGNSNDRKKEIDVVSKQVENTKKEIYNLEAELQKLISTGINNTNKYSASFSNTVATDVFNKENLVHNSNKTESQPRIRFKNFSDTRQVESNLNNEPRQISHRQAPLITITRSNLSLPKEKISPVNSKECRKLSYEYDKGKAREYIKKQREKRLEEAKALKQAQDIIAIKKQKLKELHQKSRQLVTKNVELKRKRSRSCEPNEQTDKTAHNAKQDLKTLLTNIPNSLLTSSIESRSNNTIQVNKPQKLQKNSENLISSPDEIKILTHPQLSNITIRKKSPNSEKFVPEKYERTDFSDRITSVAVENIKSLKPTDTDIEIIKSKHHNAATTIQAFYRGYRQRKLYLKLVEKRKTLQHKQNKLQKHITSGSEKDTHLLNKNQELGMQWLPHISNTSQPYNFINTVRRKINLAIGSNTPTSKTDVAVQSSFADSMCKTPTQEIFEKTKNDIKLVLEKSNKTSRTKSVISHRILNDKSKDLQVHISNSNKKSETVLKMFNKQSRKLSDSDSDTSRNIPNLSSESSARSHINTDHNVIDSHANKSVMLKDVSENHSNGKLQSGTDLPEYKLEINTEALKNLKLRRTRVRNFENTVLVMGDDTSKKQVPLSKVQDYSKTDSKSLPGSEVKTNSLVHSNSAEEVKSVSSCNYSKESSPGSFSKSSIISSNSSDYNNTKKSNVRPTSETKCKKMEENDKIDKEVAINDTANVTHLATFQEYMKNMNQISDLTVSEISAVATENEAQSEVTETDPQNPASDVYSYSFTGVDSNNLPSLERPSVILKSPRKLPKSNNNEVVAENLCRGINISLKKHDQVVHESKANSNQIHLKIEADLHLLNDFYESLRKYVELEKSVVELKNCNKHKENTLLKNCDTQTSLASQNSHDKKPSVSSNVTSRRHREITTVNYSRGSEVTENISLPTSFDDDCDTEKELAVTGFEVSSSQNISDSVIDQSNLEQSIINNEIYQNVPYVGLSLEMFDQLIKEEDTRIENLKTVLKIQEKILLDRTKGEIAWLEIQKKHLKETGQLHEVSQLKKKQRGILLTLQHDYNEMQTLKQMQKAASKERKAVLKQRRNMIKAQLSTNNMLTKVKLNTPRDNQRNSGPFKVYNIRSHSESVRSETSVSRNSAGEEVVSVTSHSIINRVSDIEVNEKPEVKTNRSLAKADKIQRSLLMREAALLKRRKAAEELLQWHQKLMEEEKKVAELEMVANSLINEVSKKSATPEEAITSEHAFQGAQLNLLWQNMTGREDKKFNDHETYPLSQIALKRLCKDAKKYSSKNNLEKNNKFNDKNCSYDSINNELDYCSDTTSAVKTDAESDKDIRSESVTPQVENINEPNFGKLDSSKKDSSVVETSLCTSMSDNYSYSFDEPVSLNNKEITNSDATLTKNNRNSESISSITELIDNLTKTSEESYLLSNKSMVNKSIDTETKKNKILKYKSKDNEVSSSTENMRQPNSNRNKLEVNKPLLLKESVSAENSRALLDNIESLKSSIQKITSKSESRIRNLRGLHSPKEALSKSANESDTCITKDIPDLVNSETVSQTISLDKLQKKCNIDVEKDKLQDKEHTLPHSSLDNSQETLEQKLLSKDNIIQPSQYITDVNEDLELTNSENKEFMVDTSSVITSNVESTSIKSEIYDHGIDILSNKLSQLSNSSDSKSLSKVINAEPPPLEPAENKKDRVSSTEEQYNHQETITDTDEITENIDGDIIEMSSSHPVETSEKDDDTTELGSYDYNSQINGGEEILEIEQEAEKTLEIEPSITLASNNVEDKPQESIVEESQSIAVETSPDLSYGIILPQNAEEETLQLEVNHSEKSHADYSSNTENHSEIAASDVFIEIPYKLSETNLNQHEKSDNTSSEASVELSESKLEQQEKSLENKDKVDVKKRVLEILADATSPRGDKSPRVQDLYVTTYDITSPGSSPELRSPTETHEKDAKVVSVKKLYGNEAEELLKKQLAIEQEIKQLELQQKEQIPFLFVREIPNKPPPPYKPPVAAPTPVVSSVLPTNVEQIETVTHHIANVLYNAYQKNTLNSTSFDDKQCNVFDDSVDNSFVKFIFDICKELAVEHYSLFSANQGPSWTHLTKKTRPFIKYPLNKNELEKYFNKKLKELFAFEKIERRENSIIKWSRKKRDHVDEILVLECQNEELEWTNYDEDELFVKNEVTNEIMNILLSDTAEVLSNVLNKRTCLY